MLKRQVLHGLSCLSGPHVTFHRTLASSSPPTINTEHAGLYSGNFILFSNSFLLSWRGLGKGLVLLWSINHLSLLSAGVGLLGWTWTPDATSCLAALLVMSSIPGVPNRQGDGEEYDQSEWCSWTQVTAVKRLGQHRGSSRPTGMTQEDSTIYPYNCHHVTCLASQC